MGFLARYNSDGSLDTAFESPSLTATGFDGSYILDFQPLADGSVVFGGRFDSVNGIARLNIAKLLSAGNVDSAFLQPNVVSAGNIQTIDLLPSGKFLVTTANNLARLNADGSLDNTFNSALNGNPISRPFVDAQGRILVNIQTDENGFSERKLRRLNADGSLNSTLNVLIQTNGTTSALASQADGKVIFGGDFNAVGGVSRNSIARVNVDGSLDTTFDSGTGFDVVPTKIVIQSNGKILVGGSFTTYNGATRRGIIRLNSDGSIDTGFNAVISDGEVYTITLRGDGKIYIGGNFTTVNNQTHNGIALLNADGSSDATFNPIFGNAAIRAVVAQTDGKVLVGGGFSGVNGFNRTKLVQLNGDGSLDATFNAGNIGSILQIETQPDSKYLVLTGSLLRLNTNGTTDSTFQTPTISFYSSLPTLSFILQPDGSIILGGRFNNVNNKIRANIARLRADGSLDNFFLQNGSNDAVNALARTADGKVLVGGSFTAINGTNRVAIARLIISPLVNIASGAKPFDYDGDGRADLSAFRPSNGTWYIARPTGGNPAQNFDSVQFGANGDQLVPADYDGDGKTDVAVFRPSNGTWYLSRSTLGYTGIQFGQAGDLPVAADYDGDGRADVSVFRSGAWYLNRTTAGYTGIAFGVSDDKPTPNSFVR